MHVVFSSTDSIEMVACNCLAYIKLKRLTVAITGKFGGENGQFTLLKHLMEKSLANE